jgi:hypothetical protein
MICEAEKPIAAGLGDPRLLVAVAQAEDALARLDERLAKNPIRDGFCARADFHDACASLWLSGELVHLEDLVLHDSDMDLRAPTHELTRAHAVLRTRRRIESSPPGACFARGLDALRGADRHEARQEETEAADSFEVPLPAFDDDALAKEFSEIDAVIARSSRLLSEGAEAMPSIRRSADDDPGQALIYDPEHDERTLFAHWSARVESTTQLPPTLAAALALEAWREIAPAEHEPWLGPLLVADLLRSRGKARAHLPCLNVGLRAVPWELRRQRDSNARLGADLAALKAWAEWGLGECDRLATSRARLKRRCSGKRGNSRLPQLADLVLAKPFVTAAMAAAELDVSARAALDMIAALELRELTGRGRFRAWGL